MFRNIFRERPLEVPPLSVPFCGRWVISALQSLGFLLTGAPGCGKSSLAAMLFRAAARNGDSGSAVDADGSLTPLLKANGVEVNEFQVHCEGGTAMDLAADITTQTERVRFAQKMAPQENRGKNNFFDAWAQIILIAALHILHHFAPKKWRLADVVRLAKDHRLISEAGKLVPGVGDVYAPLGHAGDTSRDVQATVATKLMQLSVYAALSEKAPKKASFLEPLLTGKGWNVFRWVDRYASVQSGLFSFALDTIADYGLSRVTQTRHWFGCDEIASMVPLEGLLKICRRGRKSGMCPVVTLHEILGLAEQYGKNVAEEIAALLAFKAFMKCGSPDMAKWASAYLGSCDVLEVVNPVYTGMAWTAPRTDKANTTVKNWANVSPDELMRLSRACPEKGKDFIEGYADFPDGPFKFSIPFLHVYDGVPPASEGKPVPPEWEVLEDIEDREWTTRLNFPAEVVRASRE